MVLDASYRISPTCVADELGVVFVCRLIVFACVSICDTHNAPGNVSSMRMKRVIATNVRACSMLAPSEIYMADILTSRSPSPLTEIGSSEST